MRIPERFHNFPRGNKQVSRESAAKQRHIKYNVRAFHVGTTIIPWITLSEFELISCALASVRTGYMDSIESRPHQPSQLQNAGPSLKSLLLFSRSRNSQIDQANRSKSPPLLDLPLSNQSLVSQPTSKYQIRWFSNGLSQWLIITVIYKEIK
jgi:hypothetical protein